eukprot:scaffold16227_cov30-Prasinocladus_malaysianus.AAC.2
MQVTMRKRRGSLEDGKKRPMNEMELAKSLAKAMGKRSRRLKASLEKAAARSKNGEVDLTDDEVDDAGRRPSASELEIARRLIKSRRRSVQSVSSTTGAAEDNAQQ